MLSESDCGCLLLASSFIDVLLEKMIRNKLIGLSKPSNADLETLLDAEANAPVGSFGARITLARTLGLIDDRTRTTLRMMKKLRNEAAHSWENFAFTEANVEKLVRELGKDHAKMIRGCGVVTAKMLQKMNPLHHISTPKITFAWLATLLIKRVNTH